jgi:hypothetical protein
MSVSTNEGKKIHVAISAMAPRIKAYPAKEVGGGEKLRRTNKAEMAAISPIAPIVWRN